MSDDLNVLDNFGFIEVVLVDNNVDLENDVISTNGIESIQRQFNNVVGTIYYSDISIQAKIISIRKDENKEKHTILGEPLTTLFATLAYNVEDVAGSIIQCRMNEFKTENTLNNKLSVFFVIGKHHAYKENIRVIDSVYPVFKGNSFEYRICNKNETFDFITDKIKCSVLKCPFCGKLPKFTINTHEISNLIKYTATIFCDNQMECHVLPKTSFTDSNLDTVCKQVLMHWNSRYLENKDQESEIAKKDGLCYSCSNADWSLDGCYCKICLTIKNAAHVHECKFYKTWS